MVLVGIRVFVLLPLEMGEPFLQFAPVGDFLSTDVCKFVAGVLFVEGGVRVRHIERILGFGRTTRFIFGNLFLPKAL